VTRSERNRSSSTSSRFDDSDNVTMGVRRYSGGAMRDSSVLPIVASRGGSVIPHISACRWCRNTMRGPVAHTGDRNGMPFQISTRPSRGPYRWNISLAAARGKTMYRPAFRITR
jgi:hypothetical protein